MSQPVHPALAPLTRNPLKPVVYSREPYFREACGDLIDLLGDETIGTVLRHGLVVVKPDGRALGSVGTVVDFYARHGFTPIDVRPVDFSRTVWRALWVHQMTQASVDRLMINDLILSGKGLALLLRDTTDTSIPAAVRLSELKGPAKMENQSEDCLRRAVRQPNRIFSLVHSADEPADMVRELGILFTQAERRAITIAMRSRVLAEPSARLLAEIRRSEQPPKRVFDREASRKQVIAVINQRVAEDDLSTAVQETLVRAANDLESDRLLSVPMLCAALVDAGITVDPWDLAVAVSFVMEHDVPGASKIIENLGADAWKPE